MTYAQINILTADGRLTHRPIVVTREQRIARLERYLAEMATFSWTQTYAAAERELAELKAVAS